MSDSTREKAITTTPVNTSSSSGSAQYQELLALMKEDPRKYANAVLENDPFNRVIRLLINRFAAKFGEGADVMCHSAIVRARCIHHDLAPRTPLERLLLERILVCWIETYLYDLYAAAGVEEHEMKINDKRRVSAHRRYLSALKTFAQIRRLELPVLQVNIGEKQCNTTFITASSGQIKNRKPKRIENHHN